MNWAGKGTGIMTSGKTTMAISDLKLKHISDNTKIASKEEIELAGGLARRELYSTVNYLLSRSRLKQQEIADALGVNKSVVSRMLSQPRNLTIENAGRILGTLGYWLHFNPQPAGKIARGNLENEANQTQIHVSATLKMEINASYIINGSSFLISESIGENIEESSTKYTIKSVINENV